MKKYEINLVAQTFSYYYESTETVYADSLEEAKQKAIDKFSERTLVSRYFIKVV